MILLGQHGLDHIHHRALLGLGQLAGTLYVALDLWRLHALEYRH
ncbi:MAG: hypothetical protein ABI330_04620 [Caldimonas sp.]